MTDGIKDKHRAAIVAAIAANDRVERAVLFGSRATGTNTVTSDVDIALFGDRLTLTDQARLAATLDEIPMAQSVDLLLYDPLQDQTLREHIRNHGIEWFARPMATRSNCVSQSFEASGSWSTMPFSDLVFFQEGPGIRNWQYRTQGVPFVNIRCLVNGRLDVDAMNCLDPREVEEKYRHFLLDEGDYVVSSSGTIGRIAEVCREDLPCMLNTSVIRMRPRDDKMLDRRFLRYFLTSSTFQDQIRSLASGSVQVNYGPTHLKQASILVPPHSEQRSIGHILGTLDDKIELNRQMNATLEAMARALFRSWFVDFDPVRAKMEGRDTGLPKEIADLFPDQLVESELWEIPEGWEVSEIGTEVDAVGGATPSTKEPAYWDGGKHHWATPKDLSKLLSPVLLETDRKITDAGAQKISSGLLPPGTVLLSSRAPIGYLAITEVPTAINQGFIAMICRKRLSALYVLSWCYENLEHIKDIAGGSTFAEISKKVFRPLPVVVPPKTILGVYDEASGALHERVVSNTRESAMLASLRDVLLPKLVSGELRVTAAEPVFAREDHPATVGAHEA